MTTTQELWLDAEIRPDREKAVARAAFRAAAADVRNIYTEVALKTDIPVDLIAALHSREADNKMTGRLKDGSPIAATANWKIDAAAELMRYPHPAADKWTVAAALDFAEKYNGMGYAKRGLHSPYVWSGTNHQQPGKYIADGQFDPAHEDEQPGVAAIFLYWKQNDVLKISEGQKMSDTIGTINTNPQTKDQLARTIHELTQGLSLVAFVLPPNIRAAISVLQAIEPEVLSAIQHIEAEGLNHLKFADLLGDLAKALQDAQVALKK